MNILLAVGLLTCVYMVHYEYPAVLDEPAVIGWVQPDTPAAKAGIQAGDRIVSIDGIQNPTWEQVIPREALNPNQPLEVTIERGGQIIDKDHRARGLRSEPDGFRGMGAERTELPDHRSGARHASREGRHEAGRRDRRRGRQADRRPSKP